MGSGAKSYMRKGFLIYEEMRRFFPKYEETVRHIWLCLHPIPPNFLIYEENFILFFISVSGSEAEFKEEHGVRPTGPYAHSRVDSNRDGIHGSKISSRFKGMEGETAVFIKIRPITFLPGWCVNLRPHYLSSSHSGSCEGKYRAGICRPFKEPRNRFPAWQACTQPYLSYSVLARQATYIGWRNRFLGIDSWAP